MLKDLPVINQPVQVEIDRISYPSRIEDISPSRIVIAMPTKSGVPIDVHLGDIIRVWWTTTNAILGFRTAVQARILEPLPVLILDIPEKIERIQRRNWVRQPLTLPVKIELSENQCIDARTVDLSGGGLLFSSDLSFEIGAELAATICLPNEDIKAVVMVVRSLPHPVDKNKSQTACAFKEITEKDRDKIVKAIFDFQRKMLKKGL